MVWYWHSVLLARRSRPFCKSVRHHLEYSGSVLIHFNKGKLSCIIGKFVYYWEKYDLELLQNSMNVRFLINKYCYRFLSKYNKINAFYITLKKKNFFGNYCSQCWYRYNFLFFSGKLKLVSVVMVSNKYFLPIEKYHVSLIYLVNLQLSSRSGSKWKPAVSLNQNSLLCNSYYKHINHIHNAFGCNQFYIQKVTQSIYTSEKI